MTISLAAEPIAESPLTNAFLTGIIGSIIVLGLALFLTSNIKEKPSKEQNFAEWIMSIVMKLIDGVTGNHNKTLQFLPLCATFFVFILVNNWLGLIPGIGSIGIKEIINGKETIIPFFRGNNADLNATLTLALISVGATQYFGMKHLRFKYFKKFINFSNPINFFVGILEIISEFAKIISFSFRLFGNVFAGEVLLAVITSLVPILVPLPFYGLEIFVGLVQALVFMLLSVVFFHVATQNH